VLEFDAGIFGCELPIGLGAEVAVALPGGDLIGGVCFSGMRRSRRCEKRTCPVRRPCLPATARSNARVCSAVWSTQQALRRHYKSHRRTTRPQQSQRDWPLHADTYVARCKLPITFLDIRKIRSFPRVHALLLRRNIQMSALHVLARVSGLGRARKSASDWQAHGENRPQA
jgi:hypothetical protein